MASMKCAILTMQKNEDLLLEQWINYYAKLFTLEGICIVDNGSTNEDVLSILEKYSKMGVRVEYDFNKPTDFENKGAVLAGLAQKYYSDFDYVFFLDTDEFLFLQNDDNKFNHNADDIIEYISSLPTDQMYIYHVNGMYNNVPYKPSQYIEFRPRYKIFFRGGTVRTIDVGFHTGSCVKASKKYMTKFSLVHFHNKPYEHKVQSAREKMKLRVDINDDNAIRNYNSRGRGCHLVSTLLETEEEYYAKFDNEESFVKTTSFRDKLDEYDIQINF